ncbi:MAG: UDP-N-acetylmuramoyl-L-alanyl-D-glutamate--2,6-diaminopimelate ligase, partial [Pseudomonadota bacterium]
AKAAAAWFSGQPAKLVAVTGTNGKSSVASFTRQIWAALGQRAAAFGTTGIEGGGGRRAEGTAMPAGDGAGSPLTTPDPVTLHRLLSDLAGDGVSHAAMEASSHGLDQHRLDGVALTAAAFTNLSRDHLDYHGSFDAYLAAKLGLFDRVLPMGGTAVINVDDPVSAVVRLVAIGRGQRILGVGESPAADLQLRDMVPHAEGLDVQYAYEGRTYITRLALIGAFQASNALIAAGLAIACGAPAERVFAVLPRLTGVRGRMELIGTRSDGGAVYVDYAHTPDALRTALRGLRPHVEGRLTCIIGAGGDRDPGKRGQMGLEAAKGADAVIVTDDNPRSEDPATIRKAVLEGAVGVTDGPSRPPRVQEIGDRAEAIAVGIAGLDAQDALLIAGKGHETGQQIGAETLPFDDAAVARAALADPEGAAAHVAGPAPSGVRR